MTSIPGPISVANTGALTLPLLKAETRYRGMPRRYEDTKPAVVQNFTHRYILDLGDRFHRTSVDKFEVEKNQAVKSAEEALWSRAESLRHESIEKALLKAKVIHEREVKKLQRSHAKTLKDELFKLEQELRLLSADQLKKEKEDGEKRLKVAVEETEIRAEEIKTREVEKAKIEERQKSIQEIEDLKREFKEKYAKAVEEWKADKAQALAALKEDMTKERELAVGVARIEEKTIYAETQTKLKALHDQTVRVMRAQIEELKAEIVRQEKEVIKILKQKKFVEDEVLSTRECFQKFIDDVKPFEPGKSGYVMPPLRMMRTESVLEIVLPKKASKN